MIEQVSQNLGRKVDFRITEDEYRVLRICARSKGMSVSRFVRSLVTTILAPTLLTTTEEQWTAIEREQDKSL